MKAFFKWIASFFITDCAKINKLPVEASRVLGDGDFFYSPMDNNIYIVESCCVAGFFLLCGGDSTVYMTMKEMRRYEFEYIGKI